MQYEAEEDRKMGKAKIHLPALPSKMLNQQENPDL